MELKSEENELKKKRIRELKKLKGDHIDEAKNKKLLR